jgi:D-alanine-D-alanine ligase
MTSIAILYQALPPPLIDGLRKDPKPGGYADSGADIGFALRQAGFDILTPVAQPDPGRMFDWVFPDTLDGIQAAVDAGAGILWANTVLFEGHPIEAFMRSHWIVGQLPARQQAVDDKFATNALLRERGLPVAASLLVDAGFTPEQLAAEGLQFPLVVKPVRGRGSQGVSRVQDAAELRVALSALFEEGAFGDLAIVEQYLEGEELTLTVLHEAAGGSGGPLVLPPVRRFNHADGVAPYNGVVAVTANSVALTKEEMEVDAVRDVMRDCAAAFDALGALAPLRIDCRADAHGRYYLFDVNMKPNMTGAGRPGREDQDSLCTIAAHAAGWDYVDLLTAMLACAWRLGDQDQVGIRSIQG